MSFSGFALAQLNVSTGAGGKTVGSTVSAGTTSASTTAKPSTNTPTVSAGVAASTQPSATVSTTSGQSAAASAPAAATTPTTPPSASQPEPTGGLAGQTTTTAELDKSIDASSYSVRLHDLGQQINELKEQVFRSKARLSLLAETILQGVVAGSQTRLVHENHMGSSYLLVKAVYALDGAPIFNKSDEEGGLDERKEFDIYNGSMVPGEHTITANLEYRGQGFGIFSYLKGYRFKVRSSYTFNAPEGKAITVRVASYEKGGPTAPLEDRPDIRYIERVSATVSASESEKGGE